MSPRFAGCRLPRCVALQVRLFNNLGMYAEGVQKPLLERSQIFYRQEGERLVAQMAVPEYLEHCEVRAQLRPLFGLRFGEHT